MTHVIQNSIDLVESRKQKITPSTLLIPKKLLIYFESRAKFFGSRKLYFQHLITIYGRHLHCFKKQLFSNKCKNKYQKQGLDLQPKHFKPAPEFWEEFRHIAFAYGLTMCHLFVILLKLEHDRWVEARCPKNFLEKIPRHPQKKRPGMNSWPLMSKNGKISLENLLSDGKCTILFRKINFCELKLDRMALIAQD